MNYAHRLALAFLIPLAACDTSGGGTRAVFAPPPGCAPVNDQLVVPGCRIGPVYHGMHLTELVKVMGDTRDATNHTCTDTGKRVCSVVYRWPGGIRASVSYRDDTRYFRVAKERVHEIGTSSSRYSTAEGVRIGSSALAVKAALGTPAWETHYAGRTDSRLCYPPGLFMFILNGAVSDIWLYPSNCGK